MTIRATLVAHDPCRTPTVPAVGIVEAGRVPIASAPAGGVQTELLTSTLDLRVGLSSWCGAPLAGHVLPAELRLSTGIVSVALPTGFSASCQGVPTGLFLEPLVEAPSST